MKLKTLVIIVLVSLVFVQANKAQKVLTTNFGHSSDVNCIAFSNNGKYIVSGSSDFSLKLWDIETGREIRTFLGDTSKVLGVAFSPDDKYIISKSVDTVMVMWNTKTGELIKRFTGIYGNKVSFSPDGKYIYTSNSIWDVETGILIRNIGKDFYVTAVDFSPDGKFYVTGGENYAVSIANGILNLVSDQKNNDTYRVVVWNTETGEKIDKFSGAMDRIESVSYSANGKYIIALDKYNINIWEIETGKKVSQIWLSAKCAVISPDGKYVVSGSNDTITWWNTKTGDEIETIVAHSDEITGITFSSDGKYLLSGSKDKNIKLWNSETKQEIKVFKGNKAIVNSIALSNNGEYITSGNDDYTVKIWWLKAAEFTSLEYLNNVTSVEFSPDNKYIISVSEDINIWDVENKQIKKTIVPSSFLDFTISVCFNPDGSSFLSTGLGKIKKRNTNNYEIDEKYKGSRGSRNATFSPDGKFIICSADKNIVLRNIEGEIIKTFKASGRISSLAFSPDGKEVLSGGTDGKAKIWDIEKGSEIISAEENDNVKYETFSGMSYYNNNAINSAVYSPDGKSFATASKTINLWNSKTGKHIKTFNGHVGNVNSLAFSKNGKYLFSGGIDCTIKIWEITTGKLLITLLGIANSNDYVVYAPDGRFDGTEKGIEFFHYVEGLNITPLSSLYEQYYTPNLLSRTLSGEVFKELEVKIEDIKLR